VALACYQPFWSLLSRVYFDYSRGLAWGPWLQGRPVIYCIWGSIILLLYGIYLWSTVVFGCRFSNLTHRGIITNGPYRWTKHPAYIAKNLAYWMTFVPFIVSSSLADSIRRCLLLGLVNWIYYMRAKTEEAHLSNDPDYVQYKEWIARHGIFRWLKWNR
jgi:protein-S-isoprenylcysteine O-methyltransferase Ste14